LAASLEVLERDLAELPPRAQRALQLLGEDLRRFQRMVGDLLEMSRADAGSMDVFLDEVNVGELVRRAVEAGVRTLGDEAAAPHLHVAPDLEMVHVGVDKRRFERVMTNLLENAENYGGGAVAISVDAGENGVAGQRSVQIAVEDAGPGIEPSERTKVFERFYRGSASGRRGAGTGTGLGLALVAEHMRLMHGEAWAESSATGGARFVIALPVLDENDSSAW
jgi:signal transduction histidine kinase